MDNYAPRESSWKREVGRHLLIMLTAAGVLGVFINYPNIFVILPGVILIAGVAYMSERKGGYERVLLSRKAVLVTGCDTGLGHDLAIRLSDIGVQTFAGCLFSKGVGAMRLNERKSDYLHVVQLDVTKDDEVATAMEHIKSKLGKNVFWGVVNNAGLNFLGDVELTTMAQYEKVVQINQLGMIRVTLACLPMIRASAGRVVNVTSVKGTFAEPLNAAYASTKFAGEAFSDSLRREMRGFRVDVSIIEPCNFGGATDAVNMHRMKKDFEEMWDNASEEVREAYGREYFDQHMTIIEEAIPTASLEISRVTDAMVHALFAVTPKTRYLVNGGTGWCDPYWLRSKLVHFLPTSWFDAWLRQDWKGLLKPHATSSPESTKSHLD